MAKLVPSDKVKMKSSNRKGYWIMDNDGRRLGMIGHIPGQGLRLFFERDGFKSYDQIKQNLLDVAKAIPTKPKAAL